MSREGPKSRGGNFAANQTPKWFFFLLTNQMSLFGDRRYQKNMRFHKFYKKKKKHILNTINYSSLDQRGATYGLFRFGYWERAIERSPPVNAACRVDRKSDVMSFNNPSSSSATLLHSFVQTICTAMIPTISTLITTIITYWK